ncbi:hypothetical protein BRARA_G01339 [Brassica rapa]|uniref:MD-2-related lipid-recognition domain-containing protein n=3 Tax=Brassica TaxID=3705 RepID=A0A397YVH6_BRACM|nr:MD-2-related lipid-recognition protein 3 [Brassica rapa]XP_048592823.1 MD-2-related lipid-recognition protein 3 [Brassica napus]KAG5379328.1 hypothetical protein IGI04_027170 [Brassica rapa subsp. trilocularis]RID53983.1 hypothetical protein BRARA_G01339 [Brassica rapa]CAF2164750.1 unnamed protein product [Brassica napus]CAG7902394.1 unnamed protein product [Brassica rapa]VDC98515.1 unnamed protein product [Brassica rapa]
MEILNARPVLLLLLASLFFLPALGAIDFEYCNKSGYDFFNVSRVEVSPNPVELEEYPTIRVFGYANKSMDDGTVEVKVTAGGTTQTMASYSLCVVGFECAIAAGTNFELVLAEVPLEYIEGVSKYVYSVHLTDDDVGESEEPILRMCVAFEIPTVDLALASAQSS